MKHRAAALSFAAAAAIALAACGSDNESPPVSKVVQFTTTMTPAGEPATTGNPTGNGTFTASLDTSTGVFTWSGTFTGTINLASSAPQFLTAISNDSLRHLILNNAVYVNIHTAQNPGGEIRGQFARKAP